MSLPLWVSIALWVDFMCCVAYAAISIARPGKRPSIGIDVDERYCEIAAKRLAQEILL